MTWLTEELAKQDMQLQTNDLVATGSMTPLVAIEQEDVIGVRFATFGSITIRVE